MMGRVRSTLTQRRSTLDIEAGVYHRIGLVKRNRKNAVKAHSVRRKPIHFPIHFAKTGYLLEEVGDLDFADGVVLRLVVRRLELDVLPLPRT